jgi:CBS domain containing-hemolysin-like protein
MDAFDALATMQGQRANVAVVERDGEALGVLSLEDFTAFIQLRDPRR